MAGLLRVRRPLLALIALVMLLGGGYLVRSTEAGSGPEITTVGVSSLPPQVGRTLQRIERHEPSPYPQDGTVFDNREHLLPHERDGYYHEYTVPTPDEDDRGMRRLVIGAGHEIYYTKDHYASFVRVRDG